MKLTLAGTLLEGLVPRHSAAGDGKKQKALKVGHWLMRYKKVPGPGQHLELPYDLQSGPEVQMLGGEGALWASSMGILTHNCVLSALWVLALLIMVQSSLFTSVSYSICLRNRLPSPQFHPSGELNVCFKSSVLMLVNCSPPKYRVPYCSPAMTGLLWQSFWPFSSPVHSSCLWQLQY